MLPTIFSIGSVSVSSFGLFLGLGFISAVFIAWRLGKIYELSEERLIDLAIITFFAGLIGARLYFVGFNLNLFHDLSRVLFINKYPGLSFWGGFFGGTLAFTVFAKRAKISFWQLADFAIVALFLGLFWGDIGCFLGGCGYGVPSDSNLAASVVGVVGKRFPVSLIEAMVFLAGFLYLWSQVIRFHFFGKIAAWGLIIFSIIKFITEFYRGDPKLFLPAGFNLTHLYSILLFFMGLLIYYTQSKRSIWNDAKALLTFPANPKLRKRVLLQFKKSWYNRRVILDIKVKQILAVPRVAIFKIRRRFNVKPTPKNFG